MSTFKPIFYKGHNNYDTKQASHDATALDDWPPSLTIQSQAEDADLNVLMQRFGITGKMPENHRIPQYGDYSEVMDYRTALEAVRHADAAFMEIPAPIRARFDNDPQKYLDFIDNPANIDESIKLGLRKQPTTFHVEQPTGATNVTAATTATNGGTDQTTRGATGPTTQVPQGNGGPTPSR